MTRPQDKAKELDWALELIRLVPGLGVVGAPIERERPDFGLPLAGSRIAGLEVVRAVDERIAAGRGVKKKLKARVVAGLRTAGVNAHIDFSISDGAAAVLAAEGMKEQLSDEIDGLVKLAADAVRVQPSDDEPWRRYKRFERDIVDKQGNVCWRDPSRDRGAHDLDGNGIRFCTAVMVRQYDEPLATATGTSNGQPASIIQQAIDEKAGLLAEYRLSGYDEQWLLVVGSATDGGTLDISDANNEFRSLFDRTFFLERFESICVELKVNRPK